MTGFIGSPLVTGLIKRPAEPQLERMKSIQARAAFARLRRGSLALPGFRAKAGGRRRQCSDLGDADPVFETGAASFRAARE